MPIIRNVFDSERDLAHNEEWDGTDWVAVPGSWYDYCNLERITDAQAAEIQVRYVMMGATA